MWGKLPEEVAIIQIRNFLVITFEIFSLTTLHQSTQSSLKAFKKTRTVARKSSLRLFRGDLILKIW